MKLLNDKQKNQLIISGDIKLNEIKIQKLDTVSDLHFWNINDILSKTIDYKALNTGETQLCQKINDRIK